MNLSKKGTQTIEAWLGTGSKVTTLNPNAAEFIPLALKSPSHGTNRVDATKEFVDSGTLGKAGLDQLGSSTSNNSDEEAQKYWSSQLPDDITPDFKVTEEDESQSLWNLSLGSLSLHDESSKFSASMGSGHLLSELEGISAGSVNTDSFTRKSIFSASCLGEKDAASNSWKKQALNGYQFISEGQKEPLYEHNSRHGSMINILGEQATIDDNTNHVEVLALHFPGFAMENLAEIYFASGCNLNLTVEMLTQLELQADGTFNQNLNSKTNLSAPNLYSLEFPALRSPDGHNSLLDHAGDFLQQGFNPFHSSDKDKMGFSKSSSFIPSSGATDFASAIGKLVSHDLATWKHERIISADAFTALSRSSHILSSTCNNGLGKSMYSDTPQNRGSVQSAPVGPETGDAVANMYSGQQEEARERSWLLNAYFEQAKQAYLSGNQALIKDLSAKGQLHNMQMKAAHNRAQESIYCQSNSIAQEAQGQERMIDLNGLHVSEAIHVLKHELSVLKSISRATEQYLQVYICVGTGHHTRGSYTPFRLSIAIQRYLLEEGLEFTEPQPGLLRVVIY